MTAVDLPQAQVVHACTGRARLRIPALRYNEAYFTGLTQRLEHCHGVVAVETNAATASIVIRHHGPFAHIAEFATAEQLFTLPTLVASSESALRGASQSLRGVNDMVQGFTRGVLDAPSLVYVGLVGLAVVQALRGNVAGPSTTLLWSALSLAQLGDIAKQVTRAASRKTSP
jgi:hypothetical protein